MRSVLGFVLGFFSYPVALNLLSKIGEPWIAIPVDLEKAQNYSEFIKIYFSGASDGALIWFVISWMLAGIAVGWVTARISEGLGAVLLLGLFKGLSTGSMLIDVVLPWWIWAALFLGFGPAFLLGGLLALPKELIKRDLARFKAMVSL